MKTRGLLRRSMPIVSFLACSSLIGFLFPFLEATLTKSVPGPLENGSQRRCVEPLDDGTGIRVSPPNSPFGAIEGRVDENGDGCADAFEVIMQPTMSEKKAFLAVDEDNDGVPDKASFIIGEFDLFDYEIGTKRITLAWRRSGTTQYSTRVVRLFDTVEPLRRWKYIDRNGDAEFDECSLWSEEEEKECRISIQGVWRPVIRKISDSRYEIASVSTEPMIATWTDDRWKTHLN